MIKEPPKTGPKILLWDIETSPLVAAIWGLFDQNIHIDSIIHDWFIICASWRWYGQEHVSNVSLLDDKKRFAKNFRDDKHVVKTLAGLMEQADMVVAQNGDAFDTKKLNARAIFHGLPPIPKVPSCDTLKEARRTFKFTSNKLDYISKYLGHDGKIKNEPGLWLKAMNGHAPSIKKMVKYCDGDIIELTNIYEDLRPHMKNHPNMNIFLRTDYCCPSCGSPKVQRRGYNISRTGKKQRWQCRSCGSFSSGGSTLEKSELR